MKNQLLLGPDLPHLRNLCLLFYLLLLFKSYSKRLGLSKKINKGKKKITFSVVSAFIGMPESWLLPSASRKPIRGWKALVFSAIRGPTSSIATFHPRYPMRCFDGPKDFWGCRGDWDSSNSWPLRLQSCILPKVRVYPNLIFSKFVGKKF